MSRLLLLLFSLLINTVLSASTHATEKPVPHFFLSILPAVEHHFDWDFDNIIFGTSYDEVHPDLCTTPDGQYIYACCSVLDGEGSFNTLRLRWSTDGGLSWGPGIDIAAENPIGIGRLAADNEYVYLICEYFPSENDIDIYLFRLPTGSVDPQELSTLPIATTPLVEKSPAIHSDSRDETDDPYIYITHAEFDEADSLRYWFHLSIDRGISLHRSGIIASIQGQPLAGRSSVATGKLGEETVTYFACEGERSTPRGSMVYVMTSDDFGLNWSSPQPISEDHRAFCLPNLCAYGGFALVSYAWSPVPHDLDVLYSFSVDSGRSWSEGIPVSPGESYDTEPRVVIEPDGTNFHIGCVHFLAEDSAAGTIWACRGNSGNPDSISIGTAIENDNLAAAGYQLGMCAGPNLQNLRGAAMAWTSYFITGDLDVKFDASWRGDSDAPVRQTLLPQFSLEQNWPNPFNYSTIIRFELPAVTQAQLAVHDIIGRQVVLLSFGLLSPGHHTLTFDARKMPSGVYFYTLQTSQATQTRKMILLK
jgi:hypothetical protein